MGRSCYCFGAYYPSHPQDPMNQDRVAQRRGGRQFLGGKHLVERPAPRQI
jgi:hypothetical protein